MFSNYSSSTFTLLSHSLLPICKTIILNIVLFGEKKREGVFFVFLFSILITIYLVSASCKSYIGSHMEKSTNGKLSEEEVTVHGVEEFKPDGIIHVEETPGDGHDSSSSSSSSSSDEESPVLPVDEKMEFDSVEPPLVPPSEEFIPDGELVVENMDVSDDVTELDTKEIKEQTLPSLDGDNGFVSAVVSEETLEKFLSGSNGNIGESSDVVKLASVENVETKLQLDDENIENSSKVADLESKENVEKPADVPSVDTDKVGERSVEAEIPGSQINQPIISLAPRARHMTSWRNCCGLFDFLRRSDR